MKINDYRFQLYAMAKAMYIKGTIDLSNDTDNIQEEIESLSNFATKKEDPILTLESISNWIIDNIEYISN